jgi:F-type H+-transporting ATPase subunit epsilon
MSTFPLELVTPDRLLFSEEVQTVQAPGVDGSFGVLKGHAALLTELQVGLIKLTLANGLDAYIATGGGYMQVGKDKAIILAESAELSDEIDVDRARVSADRARKLLEVPDSEINAEEIRLELDRALNRIRVAQMRK